MKLYQNTRCVWMHCFIYFKIDCVIVKQNRLMLPNIPRAENKECV